MHSHNNTTNSHLQRRSRMLILTGCLSLAVSAATPSLSAGQGPVEARKSSADVAAPTDVADDAPAEYVIGADDVLSIVFWRDQQLTSEVLVRPDGKISLPLLDEIQAAGLTPRQLRDKLTAEAKRFLSEPIVTVVVRQINSRRVYITGVVARPGQYPLSTSMTVLQLIATAGGLQEYANPKDIRIVRLEDGRPVKLRFDYTEMSKNPKTVPRHFVLQPGDTVIVP